MRDSNKRNSIFATIINTKPHHTSVGGGTITYTVGSLFAGIGGICIGFHEANFVIKWANEIDPAACRTYRNNSKLIGDVELHEGDVREFNPCNKKSVDVIAAGFPCQPYSIAGLRRGAEDPRGRPMFCEVVKKAKNCNARAIFIENVAQLRTIDNGQVFDEYMQILKDNGYGYYYERILNTKDYGGIAQYRNRLYVIAFKNEKDKKNFQRRCDDELNPIDIMHGYDEIIGNKKVDEKYYYNTEKMLRFDRDIKDTVTEVGKIYQYRRDHIRENKSYLCPTLTASMGVGGHNVPLIFDGERIRKLTPKECLDFQGFPENYQFPNGADGPKYKQIGNSVSVPVIRRLAKILIESFLDTDINNQHQE